MHRYHPDDSVAATLPIGFSPRRHHRLRVPDREIFGCPPQACITAAPGRCLTQILSAQRSSSPASHKTTRSRCSILHVCVKQVGLASNNTLRKRSINECQEGDDEVNSARVKIDFRESGAREVSNGHVRLPDDEAGRSGLRTVFMRIAVCHARVPRSNVASCHPFRTKACRPGTMVQVTR